MSWEYCSKADVFLYCGIAEERLEDYWYDMVESIITRYTGEEYGSATDFTETYDGDGTDTLLLNHKPLNSVASLSIADVEITSSEYKVYSAGYIRLVSGVQASSLDHSIGSGSTFPSGEKNISVTYNALEPLVPGYVRMGAATMISQIALVHERGGSEMSLVNSEASSMGDNVRYIGSADLTKKLRSIMRTIIGEQWRAV